MSREIKFRAWDKITKQIFEVEKIDFMAIERNVYGFITYKSILGGMNESLSFRSFDDAELMQFTGLKDRKGVEIYEGDIVKFCDIRYTKSIIGEIKFNTERGRLMIYPNVSQGRDLTAEKASKCEIIGNIFENPKLLGGEKWLIKNITQGLKFQRAI